MNTTESPRSRWTRAAQETLVGRKIVAARYMGTDEAARLGWYARAVIFELDNGVLVFPSMDDEGNGAGALFTTDPNHDTLPVLPEHL